MMILALWPFMYLVCYKPVNRRNTEAIFFSASDSFSAPLIRFRPWRYINLLTYLLTYMYT